MPGPSITSANTSIALIIPGVYSSGVLLENFDVNDIIDSEPQTLVEGRVGADGELAAGYVFNLNKFRMSFQANSISIPVFYQWKSAQDAIRDIIFGSMKIISPSLGLDVDLEEVLCESLAMLPPLKKVAEPLTVSLLSNSEWQTTSSI
jgi:hypothetical protein